MKQSYILQFNLKIAVPEVPEHVELGYNLLLVNFTKI